MTLRRIEVDEEGVGRAVARAGGPLYPCGSGVSGVLALVRGVLVVLLTACLIGLAGARSVHAGAESPTPGIWINPELGLRGPMAPHGNDRSRASITRDKCEKIRMRGMPFTDADTYDLATCLALVYVMELRPYQGEQKTKAALLPIRDTIVRLPPVVIVGSNVPSSFFGAISGEFIGDPFLHFESFEERFEFDSMVEDQPGLPGAHLTRWAVWAEDPEETVAGLRFVPRIRLESAVNFYSFEVWGVGLWPGSGDLVLVVLVQKAFRPSMLGNHLAAILCYDPRLDMFRFINFKDYDGRRKRNGTCRVSG